MLSAEQLTHRRLAEFYAGLTEPQRQFLRDTSKRRVARCSRRAGKTHVLLADYLHDGTEHGDPMAYVGLTRASAKQILWRPLERLNEQLGLGIRFNHSELIATFPSGAWLLVGGADNVRAIEKYRGIGWRKVAIDECGSFGPHIRQLVNEVFAPGLMDFGGVLTLAGTPDPLCRGMLHDADTGVEAGWSGHHWTWRDNPAIPKDSLELELTRRRLTEDDPSIQREWFGRWVRDSSRLMYPYDVAVNGYEKLPRINGDWVNVIGIDFGWNDATAFSVACYSDADPNLWGTRFFSASKMTYETMGRTLDGIIESLGANAAYSICADTGGLGKTLVESLNSRYGHAIKTAQKTEKLANAALLRSDLKGGRIKVRADAPIVGEWNALTLTEDGHEDPTQPNHLSDAFLYAYREARHYWGQSRAGPRARDQAPSNDELYEQLLAERGRQRMAEDDVFGSRVQEGELWG